MSDGELIEDVTRVKASCRQAAVACIVADP
jgi:hypothetical protein